jgi:uncharacterized membrane protein
MPCQENKAHAKLQVSERTKNVLRWALSALYAAAGILHILLPAPFLTIMPDWVPAPHFTIFATGLCEIAGAVGLQVPRWRKAAGLGLALYAVAVFPANIKHAMLDLGTGTGLGWWYHIPRFALQPLLVWAAWISSRDERSKVDGGDEEL